MTQSTSPRITSPLTEAVGSCRQAFIATGVMSVFINLTMLALPLYSIQVYDRVLTSRNGSTLVMLTLIVVLFLVLYGALEYQLHLRRAVIGAHQLPAGQPSADLPLGEALRPAERGDVGLDGIEEVHLRHRVDEREAQPAPDVVQSGQPSL